MSQDTSRDELQPDDVGRFGRVPLRANGIQRKFNGRIRSTARSGLIGRGTTVFPRSHKPQRVTVKFHLVRHQSSGHGQESLARHVHYLRREGVGLDGADTKFYTLGKGDLDPKALSKEWAEDRHHFRVIISPERGRDVLDLQEYTREVMRRVEKDLETKLDWVAVDHFNTDQPHSHVLLRGRSEERDLIIQKPYIKHGFRERAQEVATGLLGERTKEHARESLTKQIHAERWTELDFLISRLAEKQSGGRTINVSQVNLRPGATFRVEIIIQRLRFMNGLGLASNESEGATKRWGHRKDRLLWVLNEGYKKALRDLGDRNDVIKQIHQAMGREANGIVPYVERLGSRLSEDVEPVKITGTVITKGRVDELSDNRFVVIEDHGSVSKRAVQAQVFASPEYDALEPGSVVSLQPTKYRNANMILNSKFDVQQQITAEAWTWLDKQIYRYQKADEEQKKAFRSNKVYLALQKRAAWMFANGYAVSTTPRVTLDSFRLKAGISKKLKGKELATLSSYSQNPEWLNVLRLEENQKAVGKLLGIEHLHQGTVAVLKTKRGLLTAPLFRAPKNVAIGSLVQVAMSGSRRVSIQLATASMAKSTKQRDTSIGLGDE